MCPNHVTPADLLAIKCVDGHIQERRVRRPRNLLLVDAEPNTSYDRDSTFDDDWRADRLRFPPGDMIMDFVSAVKEDRKNTNKDIAERLAKRMVAVTTLAVKDLARNGGNASEEWMQNFESLCESEAQHVRDGDSREREIKAADALLDMLHGGHHQQSTPLQTSQPEQPAEETPATIEAEKESQKIVQQARQYRTQRLKDAHSEATKEIEAYKAQKDQEFKTYEASHAGNTQNIQAAVDKETDAKLGVITQQFDKNKDAVVKKLLDRVILVQPELHRNLEKLNV